MERLFGTPTVVDVSCLVVLLVVLGLVLLEVMKEEGGVGRSLATRFGPSGRSDLSPSSSLGEGAHPDRFDRQRSPCGRF